MTPRRRILPTPAQSPNRRRAVLAIALGLALAPLVLTPLSIDAGTARPASTHADECATPLTAISARRGHPQPARTEVHPTIAAERCRSIRDDGAFAEGIVVNTIGAPVASATVCWLRANGTVKYEQTDQYGQFVFLVHEPTEGSIVAFAPALGTSRSVTATPGEFRLVIQACEPRLSGRVEFPNGRPAAFVEVRIEARGNRATGVGPTHGTVRTNADGAFAFYGIGDRAWRASIADDARAPSVACSTGDDDVVLTAATPRIRLVIRSPGTCDPQIRVTAWSDPASIASVERATHRRETIPQPTEFDAVELDSLTGDGFTSVAVPADSLVHALAISHDAHLATVTRRIPKDVGATILELPMVHWRRDSGVSIRSETGRQPLGIEVETTTLLATFLDVGPPAERTLGASIPADHRVPLPPGRYRLHVHAGHPSEALSTESVDIEVPDYGFVRADVTFDQSVTRSK